MGTIGCGKPKWIHSVVRKWIENKQNVCVVGWTNNQAHAFGPTHERRCAHMTFEGTSTKSETNFCFCSDPPKKPTIRNKIKSLGSQRVGFESTQTRVIKFKYLEMPFGTGKC
jgi:hypothetical protein